MNMRSWIRSLFTRRGTRTLRKAPKRVRLEVEELEARLTPTTYTVTSGLASDLVAAINTANSNGQASNTILLSGTYTLTGIDNYWYGPNGLPAISSNLTIAGARPTARSSSATRWRRITRRTSGCSTSAAASPMNCRPVR